MQSFVDYNGPPLIARTTSNNGVTTTYAVAVPQSSSTNTTLTLSMSDLGVSGTAWCYNYFTGTASELPPRRKP